MPTLQNFRYLRHRFSGGWATDFGPTADVVPQGDLIDIPFLLQADNCFYELDGGPHKEYGTTELYSSALESGATIKGLFDYWIQAAGSPAQHRIIHIGTKVYKDDGDETFTQIASGLTSGAIPHYSQFDDILIVGSKSSDTPKSWDGTTWQDLAGSPPNFSFSAVHTGLLFASGVDALPSRLYWSASFDPEDWTGAGAGYIDIDPDDGDRITGMIPYKGNLIIFKGPYKGSIHVLSGTSATGSAADAFRLKVLQRGIGATGQNQIAQFGDDIAFMWSDGHLYSLQATDRFGDYREAAQITRPIATWVNEHYNFSKLEHSWLVNWPSRGIMLLTVPVDSSTDPNFILMVDYRFDPPRLAPWPNFDDYKCLALVIDPDNNNRRVVMAGSDDGKVYKFGHSTRSLKGSSAITFRVTTPYLNYGSPILMKTLAYASLSIAPKNNGNLTFGWQRDDNAQQTRTISQGGTDVLGEADANEFTLGTSQLGGARFVDRYMDLDEGGQFRSVQYQILNSAVNEDVELHSVSSGIQVNGISLEN